MISILTHWSCEKICKLVATSSSPSIISDEQIFQILLKQLLPYNNHQLQHQHQPRSGVSYLSIAEVAYSMKRKVLAKLLLEKEEDPNAQIPLLLR